MIEVGYCGRHGETQDAGSKASLREPFTATWAQDAARRHPYPESERSSLFLKGIRQPGLQAIPAVRGLVFAVAGPVVGVKAVRRVGIDNNL